RVQVSYTDAQGTSEGPLSSAQTATIGNVNDAPSGGVSIDNSTPVLGDTLTAGNNLADSDGVGTVSYQWQRNGANITGATGASYFTTQADVGAVISVVASYTDGGGTFESVSSSSTAAVAPSFAPIAGNTTGGGGTIFGARVSGPGDLGGDAGAGNETSTRLEESPDGVSGDQSAVDVIADESVEQDLGLVSAAATLLPAGSGRIVTEPVFAAASDANTNDRSGSGEVDYVLNDTSSMLREADPLTWLTPEWLLPETPQIDQSVSFVAGPVSVVDLAKGGVLDEIAGSGDGTETITLAEGVQFASIALTAGAVTWAIQAGGLLTSLLVSMPVWREFDPLPVVTEDENKDRDDEEQDDEASGEEAVAASVFAAGRT
ncbi:MAG: hypothetical protein JSU95_18445, partial [Betaproteobacteria bacterium]